MSWYLRGGSSYADFMYNTDLEDHEIIGKLIKDNIENTKNSRLPLI